PLMTLSGVLLEGSLRRDALGLLSVIGLSWILAPFQAYASRKAMSEKKEGGWGRTPKSGVVTERLERFHLARLMPWEMPKRKRTAKRSSRAAHLDIEQHYASSGQAITYKATANATGTNVSTIQISGSGGYNDVMVAWVAWRGAVTISLSPTTNGQWRFVRSTTDATNSVTSAVFISIFAVNGAASQPTFNSSAPGDVVATMVRYSGVDPNNPIDAE